MLLLICGILYYSPFKKSCKIFFMVITFKLYDVYKQNIYKLI